LAYIIMAVGKDRGRVSLAATVQPVLGIQARLAKAALTQSQHVPFESASHKPRVVCECLVKQHPIVLHRSATNMSNHARHKGVAKLVPKLKENLIVLVGIKLEDALGVLAWPFRFAKQLVAIRAYKYLDLAMLPQVR
jgi:hypothetical protein